MFHLYKYETVMRAVSEVYVRLWGVSFSTGIENGSNRGQNCSDEGDFATMNENLCRSIWYRYKYNAIYLYTKGV